ncbi:MAG: 2,3-bisphosphoglycerate-independent phosphoglycerate mutase, partial [Armatimonadetes bacterium]|nr:2,3-bisphosphoglycerate-independent phosphoglycerate mutase [Armatimonadota bacterium]
MKDPKKVLLMILDGWGINPSREGNAIAQAHTPNMIRFAKECPSTSLLTSGAHVGLPDGQMGNSEVGHLNLGAGRIVYQEIARISKAIQDGSFFENPEFLRVMKHVAEHQVALHLLGLVSDGGVHSSMDHLFALLEMAQRNRVPQVYLHAFLDGRDTPPDSSLKYLGQGEERMKSLGLGKIATIAGRYYPMDRDKRWDRVQMGYDALVFGKGVPAASVDQAVRQSYTKGVTDEFVLPTVIQDAEGRPVALIGDGDGVIFFNFRADRARQLTSALALDDFSGFDRPTRPKIAYVCMSEYDDDFNLPVAFPVENIRRTIGEIIDAAGLLQFRIAETEKYAHVTYFFNGGREEPFSGEERQLIPSPKVATYDLQPQMSAGEVTEKLVSAIQADRYAFILVNYANSDMVGHTGIMAAAIQAVSFVDECVGKVVETARSKGWTVLITADHGNSELMIDPVTGGPHTAHTTNPVPFHIVTDREIRLAPEQGILADVAPTILYLMGIESPPEMTG